MMMSSPELSKFEEGAMVRGGARWRTLACMLAVVGFVTAADLLLKRGALASVASGGDSWVQKSGIGVLGNWWTVAGIGCHLMGLMAWLQTLRVVPLTVAYCFTAMQQATIALGCWLWLGEAITPMRWCGIGVVFAGVLVLVPAIVQAEQAEESAEGGA